MAQYNTPYKSGEISAINGVEITLNNITLDNDDVGRILVITSGNARLQHRQITGVSGQTVTLSHSLDSQPFIDTSINKRATDILPVIGDTIAISYIDDDIISADDDMTLSNDIYLNITGNVRVEGNAYILFRNKYVRYDSQNIEISTGGGMIFGYYNYVSDLEDSYTKDNCYLTDIASGTGGNQMARGNSNGSSFGLFDIYGGTLNILNNTFYRCYQNAANSREVQCRWINLYVNGSLGARVDGDRSMLLVENVNGFTAFGISNPRAAVARIEFSAYFCNQAGYIWLAEGAEGRIVFKSLKQIQRHGIRIYGDANGDNKVYEVIAKKQEVDLLPVFLNVEQGRELHTVRYGNLLKPFFVDATGSFITSIIKTRLYDATDTFINEEATEGGEYSEIFIRHTDIATTTGNKVLSDGTLYAPYSLRSVKYGKKFTVSNISAEDSFFSNIVMLDDDLITDTEENVALYSQINTVNQFYDASVLWLQENITDEQGFLVNKSGNEIVLEGINLLVTNANEAFSYDKTDTITINSDDISGMNIISNSQITVDDGVNIENCRFSSLNLNTATDISNVTILGVLSYNDDDTKNVNYSNVSVDTLENRGSGNINFIIDANSSINNTDDAEVSVRLKPTPSLMNLEINGRFAIYDNNGDLVTTGDNNVSYNNADDDTGEWSVICHRKGYNSQIFKWQSDNESTNNFVYSSPQIIRPEGGAAFTDETSTNVSTEINENRIHTEISNTKIVPKLLINSIQDFLNTDEGLNWSYENEIFSAPTWGVLSGITFMLNIEGFTYDSTSGVTSESSVSAILVSSASHSNVLADNGGVIFASTGGSSESISEEDFHRFLDSYANKDDYKSNEADLTTVTDLINGLNDFDPGNDTVSRVTLVDTTTTNTDMRGTDNVEAADYESDLTQIKNLINALNDISVSDINSSNVIAKESTLDDIADLINGLNNFDPENDIVSRVTLVDTTTNTDNTTEFSVSEEDISNIASRVWSDSDVYEKDTKGGDLNITKIKAILAAALSA